MKANIKLTLCGLAFLSTIVANASKKLNVKVASKSSKLLSISLLEVKAEETVIIKDFKGRVLFSEKIKPIKSYTKIFDFSTLPMGVYKVESKDDKKLFVAPVVVKENSIFVIENSIKTYSVPEVIIENNILRVIVNNNDKKEVEIELYNNLGVLLKSEDSSNNDFVYRSYDISEIKSDKIKIFINQAGYSFVRELQL